MRSRFLALSTFTLVLLMGVALFRMPLPAFAQRDPFHPLVVPQGGTAPSSSGQVATPSTGSSSATSGSSLPKTGIEVLDYAVFGVVLIAIGTLLLLVDRYRLLITA